MPYYKPQPNDSMLKIEIQSTEEEALDLTISLLSPN